MENRKNIPFSPPDISELEIQYVTEAMKSGWITTGPRTKKLEKEIAGWFGLPEAAPNCVCLNSATAALELALRVLGIGAQEGGSEKDEVITCAYTYTASASVVAHVGAKLVLVDCSPKSGSVEMDYEKLAAAITPNTKAIIPVDLGGVPCDWNRVFAIAEEKKALFTPSNDIQKAIGRVALVADGAHAFGAKYGDRYVGNVADFTSFSFHAVKNFTTAEGGALTWKSIGGIADGDIYRQLQLFSLHGQSKDALAKTKVGAWEYDIVGTWYKCNMTDIMAAIGQAQFERYPALLARRKEIVEKYDKAFTPLGIEVLDHYTEKHTSTGHLYLTRIPGITCEQRQQIMDRMGEAGVSTNVHYKPLPMHTAYKKLGFDIKDFPVAYEKFANEITLPLHTLLTDEDVDYIISVYTEILKDFI